MASRKENTTFINDKKRTALVLDEEDPTVGDTQANNIRQASEFLQTAQEREPKRLKAEMITKLLADSISLQPNHYAEEIATPSLTTPLSDTGRAGEPSPSRRQYTKACSREISVTPPPPVFKPQRKSNILPQPRSKKRPNTVCHNAYFNSNISQMHICAPVFYFLIERLQLPCATAYTKKTDG